MPAAGALALQALVDEALMRRVLVDDDDAVAGLRDDVGAVDLRARGAERRLARLVIGSASARASARGRADVLEARLLLGEARRRGAASGACQPAKAPACRRPGARCGTSDGRGGGAAGGRRWSRVRAPPVVAARKPGAGDRLLEGADDEGAHERRVAEAHLGLGRMHVDVDVRAGRGRGRARGPDGGRAASRPHRRRAPRRAAACRAPGGR